MDASTLNVVAALKLPVDKLIVAPVPVTALPMFELLELSLN